MSYMMGFFGGSGEVVGDPPTFEAVGTLDTNDSGPNPLDVPYPAGLQADDIAFLHCVINDSAAANSVDTPAGWTLVDQELLSGLNFGNHALFWKRLTGSESGTVTVNTAGSIGTDDSFGGIMSIWRGAVASGTPYEGLANNTGQSTSMASAAVTTTGSNRTVVHFGATRGGASGATASAGYTEQYDQDHGTGTVDLGLMCFSIERASAGIQAAATHTIANSLRWQVMALALIPA